MAALQFVADESTFPDVLSVFVIWCERTGNLGEGETDFVF